MAVRARLHHGAAQTRRRLVWCASSVVVLLLTSGLGASVSSAHPGPGGAGSSLHTATITLEKVHVPRPSSARPQIPTGKRFPRWKPNPAYSYNRCEDGLDMNCEFYLVVTTTHRTAATDTTPEILHGSSTATFEIDDLGPGFFERYSVANRTWTINSQLWQHDECTPRENIAVGGTLVEVDSDFSTVSLSAIASGLAGAAVEGAISGSWGGPIGVGAGIGAGVIVGIATGLNGADDYGAFAEVVPENNEVVAHPEGPRGATIVTEGEAFIHFHGTWVPTPDPEVSCEDDDGSQTGLSPDERHSLIFGALDEGVAVAADIRPEPGNPGGLTRVGIAGLRQTMEGLAVGSARLAAGFEIDAAAGYQGVEDAIDAFAAAQEQPSPAAAIELFGRSYLLAANARLEGAPAEERMTLPHQVHALTGTYSSEAGKRFNLPVYALGGTDGVEFVATEPTGTIGVEIEQLGFERPLQRLVIDTEGAPPGTYTIQLAGFSEGGAAESALSLVVHEDPSSCFGLAPTLVNRRQGTVRGTPGGDVIAGVGPEQQIRGGRGADVLCASSRGSFLHGGSGADLLFGGAGPDVLIGGSGRDRIAGARGPDDLRGGAGPDLLDAGSGRDWLHGGGGNDTLYGGRGNDRYLKGGPGTDRCFGGPGRDAIYVGGRNACESYR